MPISAFFKNKSLWILSFSLVAIAVYLMPASLAPLPLSFRQQVLVAVIILGGLPMIYDILKDLFRGELGADALAAVSIITSLFLKQYLAGSFIVLMLATGGLLETYAIQSASSALGALMKRIPKMAHRKEGTAIKDIAAAELQIGDEIIVFPHEIAAVDGTVIEGHGTMDESYLTGEPFLMSKAPGSEVFSGAINGESALTIRATKKPTDSRFAKITAIMRSAEEKRPHMRRLADQIGAYYTPLALALAGAAWALTGNPNRFLAVIVVATPCPLIIAIPITIIGAISLCARRGIVVRNPIALEQIQLCRTAIFDKTGTLTYGEPALVEQKLASGLQEDEVLSIVSSLERYSKHPLAQAIQRAAAKTHVPQLEVSEVHETPGHGLKGVVQGKKIEIVGRKRVLQDNLLSATEFSSESGGLECFALIDGRYAAYYRFRDAPRAESPSFIQHLGPRHAFTRQLIISGDRASEVQYLADAVGISEVHAGKSPEEKLKLVRAETAKAKTLYIGDGINDAPALLAATVGIAVGENSNVTSEAASVVVLETSLRRVDEFMHISERMRAIAIQCAVGGMALSAGAMLMAALGYLHPVAGAVTQEVIDIAAIANALRAALPPRVLTDL